MINSQKENIDPNSQNLMSYHYKCDLNNSTSEFLISNRINKYKNSTIPLNLKVPSNNYDNIFRLPYDRTFMIPKKNSDQKFEELVKIEDCFEKMDTQTKNLSPTVKDYNYVSVDPNLMKCQLIGNSAQASEERNRQIEEVSEESDEN